MTNDENSGHVAHTAETINVYTSGFQTVCRDALEKRGITPGEAVKDLKMKRKN
jgi:hypothetical protein